MGIFDKIFGSGEERQSKEEKKPLPWQELTSLGQLETIEETSKVKLQAIFKHSTRCGISRMVIQNFERNYDLEDQAVDLYYLDLLNHRDISAEIAVKFQVYHESPQFIIIKNGETVYHASHSSITPEILHRFI